MVPEREAGEAEAPAQPQKEGWLSTLRFLLILFVSVVVLRSCIVAPYNIPSGSMLPNLMIGDYLFVAKWPYGYSRYAFPFNFPPFEGRIFGGLPDRGDIVVFDYPGHGGGDYVKRVIGLPGDTIEVRGGQVILNGQPIPRVRVGDYLMPVSPNSPCRQAMGSSLAHEVREADGTIACAYPQFRETLPSGRSYMVLDQGVSEADNYLPVRVPPGHLFVMGDNRDDSEDSRFGVQTGGVGFLDADRVIGRALIDFWSTDGSANWFLPWTWVTAARWSRIGGTYP